jgi:hypothetical protein
VIEVIQRQKPGKAKQRSDTKTDWEKNSAQLRTKERKLNAKGPVPPIKHHQ